MKTYVVITAAMVALVCGPALAHHPAADIVDPEVYERINDNLEAADSPHLDMVMDDMGRDMEEISERAQDRSEAATGMIDAAQERSQMAVEQADAARERAETSSQRSDNALERTENADNRGDNTRARSENAENRYSQTGVDAGEVLDLESTIDVIE